MGYGKKRMGSGILKNEEWGKGNGERGIVVRVLVTEKLECVHRRKYSGNTKVVQYAEFLSDVHVDHSSVISSTVSPAWKLRVLLFRRRKWRSECFCH